MYEKEEEQLKDYKNMYENIKIPLVSIDDAILAGFQKAKLEKKRKPRRQKWVFSLVTAALILVGFFTSIRLSPAFAGYITVIPGMEKVVELIRYDKGKMMAIENDYYEKIDVSKEKNGLKFTIDGAIADENGLALFYTIKSKEKQTVLETEGVQLSSQDGKSLNLSGISMGSPLNSEKGELTHSDMFEFYVQSPLESKKFELKVRVKGKNLQEDFKLKFELKKKLQKKKTYALNKTVTIDSQKISFLKADIYPLRVAVHVKMDPNNTKRIFSFDDLRLVDENGETWNKIQNGVIASIISPDEYILYLQSNYFRNPKELYLVLNKIQAIDKDEVNVVVDTEKLQILKQPNGGHLSNLRIVGNNLYLSLRTKKEFNYFLFINIKDGDGKKIESNMSSVNGNGEKGITEIGVNIPNLKNQTNPISLELSNFPSWIIGNEKIKIK